MPPPRDPRQKPGERLQRALKTADDAIGEAVREDEQSGALRHLYGQPLDLSDDSPEWLVNRFLKNAGFSHPTLERAKELDQSRQQIEQPLQKLRRRRSSLTGNGYTAQQAQAFNELRQSTLDDYRQKLTELNRALLTYNLGAPNSLHRPQIRVEQVVERAAQDLPPLELIAPSPSHSQPAQSGLWRRLRRKPSSDG